jgi:hypothetical protein
MTLSGQAIFTPITLSASRSNDFVKNDAMAREAKKIVGTATESCHYNRIYRRKWGSIGVLTIRKSAQGTNTQAQFNIKLFPSQALFFAVFKRMFNLFIENFCIIG